MIPSAIFIDADGKTYPDSMVCSGRVFLDNQVCPYSIDGKMPPLETLKADDPTYSIDKGRPGDLCPRCAKQQLGSLGKWDGHRGVAVPAELHPLRLFKCNQWFWLVVPGLTNASPGSIEKQ